MTKSYNRFASLFFGILFLIPSLLKCQKIENTIISASESISYDYFFRNLSYLASDELKGRGLGTPEYDSAANYIADSFKENGLIPFGDRDTYFQQVELVRSSIREGTFSFLIKNKSRTISGKFGKSVSPVLNPKHGSIDEENKIVFVGYGNIIPQLNINDYQGVDVNGKVVVVALGGPKGMEHPAFNDRIVKFENAVANGATGLILFYPKASLIQNMIFKKVHGFLSKSMLSLQDDTIDNFLGVDELRLLAFAKKELVRNILKTNGFNAGKAFRKMGNGNHKSIALEGTIQYRYALNNEIIQSKNVVGLLPGSNDTLKNEYVIVGAHLDGFGIGKPVRKDSIYNGMMDNASGISAILSQSKVFNDFNIIPSRSIVFIAYTAEENGLLGSTYYANKNNIKDGKMVASINIDMLAQTIETADMAALGYSHSNLSEAADFAAQILEIEVDNNLEAEIAYIERSDQISFIKKDIPVLFIAGGFTAKDPKKDGEKVFDKWMKEKYHSPFDDMDQPYSKQAFLTSLRFNFLTTYYVADTLDTISWNTNSWLRKKYMNSD